MFEIDLTPFLPLLKQFGPWGWVAAGVIWFIQFRRQKSSPLPIEPNKPDKADGIEPLIDRIRNRFPNAPVFGEFDPVGSIHAEDLIAQREEIERQIERRREGLIAQLEALKKS